MPTIPKGLSKKTSDDTLAMKRVFAAFMSAAILAPITVIPVTLVTPIEAHALSRKARESRDKIERILESVAQNLVIDVIKDAIKSMHLSSLGKESQTLDRMSEGIDRVVASSSEEGELAEVEDIMEVVVEVCEEAGAVGDLVITGLVSEVAAEAVAE